VTSKGSNNPLRGLSGSWNVEEQANSGEQINITRHIERFFLSPDETDTTGPERRPRINFIFNGLKIIHGALRLPRNLILVGKFALRSAMPFGA